MQSDRYELHVWCTTGTVGSYLDHPRQGKTQLYRRNVDWSALKKILNNPRAHTGAGYHERAELDRREQRDRSRSPPPANVRPRERSVPCPGCGKMHYTMGDTAQHFESGRCSACPGQDNARRAAYAYARGTNLNNAFFTNATPMLTFNGAGAQDYSNDYQHDGTNYRCPACQRSFRMLSALLNHLQAKPECRAGGHAQIGFGGY